MDPAPPSADLPAIAAARAVRFGFAAIVLGMSYPNIHCALALPKIQLVFQDMLGARPLPAVTSLVLHLQPLLVGISILIPLVSLGLVFTRGLVRSTYASGALIFVVFLQLFFTWFAVTAPLLTIIGGMQGGS